jgi:hypothetical protein
MLKRRLLATFLIGLWVPPVHAGDGVKVPGSDTKFPAKIESRIGGKSVRLALTGTALRTKYLFNVYAIGSYIQEGVAVHDAEGLARAPVPKQLHLVFERDVDGDTMARSFRESIALNHPAPAFGPELASLTAFFRRHPAKEGSHIWLTYIPGVGLECQEDSQPVLLIKNVGFAQAAWEAYLGRNNLGVAIQSGLSSRL